MFPLLVSRISSVHVTLESLSPHRSAHYSSLRERFLRIPISKQPVTVYLLLKRDHGSAPSVQYWRIVQSASYFFHLLYTVLERVLVPRF
jgi:hypothetical protein